MTTKLFVEFQYKITMEIILKNKGCWRCDAIATLMLQKNLALSFELDV